MRFYAQDTWRVQDRAHAQLRPRVELREHAGQSRSRQAGVPRAALRQRSQPDAEQLQQLLARVRLCVDARRREQDGGARRRRPLLGDGAAVAPLAERAAIGPVGNGRLQVPHTSFTNIFPGIINLNTGQPVPVGASLPASGQVTNMTIGQFMQIYNAQIGGAAGGSWRRRASTICRCATSRSARRPAISTRSSIRCSTPST